LPYTPPPSSLRRNQAGLSPSGKPGRSIENPRAAASRSFNPAPTHTHLQSSRHSRGQLSWKSEVLNRRSVIDSRSVAEPRVAIPYLPPATDYRSRPEPASGVIMFVRPPTAHAHSTPVVHFINHHLFLSASVPAIPAHFRPGVSRRFHRVITCSSLSRILLVINHSLFLSLLLARILPIINLISCSSLPRLFFHHSPFFRPHATGSLHVHLSFRSPFLRPHAKDVRLPDRFVFISPSRRSSFLRPHAKDVRLLRCYMFISPFIVHISYFIVPLTPSSAHRTKPHTPWSRRRSRRCSSPDSSRSSGMPAASSRSRWRSACSRGMPW
jgi:hypothetical protein